MSLRADSFPIRPAAFAALMLLHACSEEKIVNNPLPDLQPPVVGWVSPPGGAAVSGVITVAFTAKDESGVDSARLYLNGYSPDGFRATGRSDTLYSFRWDTHSDSDGVYSLEARAWDKAGNAGGTPALLVRVQNSNPPPPPDRTPPRLRWVAPPGGSEVSGILPLVIEAHDSSGIDSLRLFKNGFTAADYYLPGHDDTLYAVVWDTRNDSDGVHVFEARGYDRAGNAGFCPALVVRVHNLPTPPPEDGTPPRIEWLAPTGVSVVSGMVTLSVKVVDNVGVSAIWIYKNGYSPEGFRLAGRADSVYAVLWDTRADYDGVHTLEVRAWDAAGNVGIGTTLNLRVENAPPDRTPPEIGWIEPVGGSELRGTVTLRLWASDYRGVDSVWVYKNGVSPASLRQGTDPDGVYEFTWDTESDADGVYVLEAWALDVAQNVGFCPALVVRVHNLPTPPPEDRTPPRIEWLAPTGVSVVSGMVTLSVKVVDNVGVSAIWIYKNGYSPDEFRLAGRADSVYAVLWDTRADEDGVHTLEVRAWDAAGNVGIGTTLNLRVENAPPDRTPPDVWWESPDAGATLRDTVQLIVRWFDESGVDSIRLLKDGAAVGQVFNLSGQAGSLSYLWETRSDSDGVHLWEARGWDSAGNMSVSPALVVRVKNNPEPPIEDHRPPVIVWRAPTPGDTLQGRVELRFDVMDDVGVDSARVYLNGRSSQNFLVLTPDIQANVTWVTNDYPDGNYLIEVRAWDRSGNVGASVGVVFRVWNNRPRVIWVPDEYQTIQGAINASVDGDTVMVRAGEYHESIQMFDKNVSLISELGPEVTVLNTTGFYRPNLSVRGGQDSSMLIRGFTFFNQTDLSGACLYISESSSSPMVVNNIFTGPGTTFTGIYATTNAAIIRNNLIIDLGYNVQMGMSFGDFRNNMAVRCSESGFWNAAGRAQPLIPDYNLFWNNGLFFQVDVMPGWGEHNLVDVDPRFIGGTITLREDSPARDAGSPDILDSDGSRSDIGVYGGPFQYPPPND